MANLFSYGSVRNKPARSGFDWSEHFSFTAKAGELLPVYWKFLLPGTKVNLNLSSFTRTMPVNTAAFTRVKEYFDWYFVPLRLINKSIGQALVQMQDQPVQATSIVANKSVTLDLPWTNAASMYTLLDYAYETLPDMGKDKNLNGFSKAATSAKLLRYLRYGNCYYTSKPSEVGTNNNFGLSSKSDFNLIAAKNVSFNVLPLAAYQKIYCDWFRFEQWENACPYTYNFDYYNGGNVFNGITANPENFWSNDNILSLRYANYNKDLFMGVMPSSQFGSVATVSVNNIGDSASGNALLLRNVGGNNLITSASASLNPLVLKQVGGSISVDRNLGVSVSSLKSSFDILSFRIAEATQKWKEVTQCAKQGYKEQLEAHFNVKLSEALSDHCRYIGGTSSGVTISEVLNTNLDTASSAADIKGKGVGGSFGSETFETNEHGILMCIYHAVPVLDYLRSGQDLQLLSTLATDLPIPEFDHIGMEALPVETLFNESTIAGSSIIESIPVLGYVPRYAAYKTSVDWVSGAFETTLNSWVAPLTVDQQVSKLTVSSESGGIVLNYSMTYGFFKVTPRVLDPIFVTACNDTWDTDQFLVNVAFNVKPVQNLDYNGMPY
jgi:hypothetical protein